MNRTLTNRFSNRAACIAISMQLVCLIFFTRANAVDNTVAQLPEELVNIILDAKSAAVVRIDRNSGEPTQKAVVEKRLVEIVPPKEFTDIELEILAEQSSKFLYIFSVPTSTPHLVPTAELQSETLLIPIIDGKISFSKGGKEIMIELKAVENLLSSSKQKP